MLKNIVKKVLSIFRLEIVRFESAQNFKYVLGRILDYYTIDIVIDIGANIGQFGKEVVDAGYRKKIISLEPQASAFSKLEANARSYSSWETHHCAIGGENTSGVINISENSVSSSLLDAEPILYEIEKGTKYIRKESIVIKRLDNFVSINDFESKNIYTKLDVQGYELEILLSNKELIGKSKFIQIELSFLPLYTSASSASSMIELLNSWGYKIYFIFPEFIDKKTGKLLEAVAVFIKEQ